MEWDYIIIGSGFGGSVSAYRLTAEQLRLGKPASVCVLERGALVSGRGFGEFLHL